MLLVRLDVNVSADQDLLWQAQIADQPLSGLVRESTGRNDQVRIDRFHHRHTHKRLEPLFFTEVQPRFKGGSDKRMQLGALDILFAHAEQLGFLCCKSVMVLSLRTWIADQLILFVQPDFSFYIQRRLAHRQRPAVSSVSNEVGLMNGPATRSAWSKSRIEEILHLRRSMMLVCQRLDRLDQAIGAKISCHIFSFDDCNLFERILLAQFLPIRRHLLTMFNNLRRHMPKWRTQGSRVAITRLVDD